VLLYDMLLRLARSPVTRLHRGIALGYTSGAGVALAELDELGDALSRHRLSTRRGPSCCALLVTRTRPGSRTSALAWKANRAEQAVVRRRLEWT
jgi:predicted RNA polymerase sigma factor